MNDDAIDVNEVQERIERALEANGTVKPEPEEYRCRQDYFKALSRYQDKYGYAMSEVLNGRLKL